MSLLLGIDGGGSKTTALLAQADGTVIGRGSGGPSNYRGVSVPDACNSLDQAIRGAFAAAGLPADPRLVGMACFGMAGVERPGDDAPLRAWLEQRWPGMPCFFVSDVRLVVAAGTPAGWGLGVICGTGSNIYGRTADGRSARAGGWGYLLGDEGSGYETGMQALRAVARAADGRTQPTALTGLVLAHWSLSAPGDLIGKVYDPQLRKAEIAALTHLVAQAAAHGDETASSILAHSGQELALAASAVARQLDLRGPLPCALVGGVLLQVEPVRAAFLAAAENYGLDLNPVQQVSEPAVGAVRLAQAELQLLGRS